MRGIKLFFILLCVLIIHSKAFSACLCSSKPEVETAYNESSCVFIGRVEESQTSALRPTMIQVKMTVLRRFKFFEDISGADTVVLWTPNSKDSCGITFQPGFDYLVFTKGNPAYLTVNSCSRTEVLEKAMLDQQRVQKMLNK